MNYRNGVAPCIETTILTKAHMTSMTEASKVWTSPRKSWNTTVSKNKDGRNTKVCFKKNNTSELTKRNG